ncbi:hypothetical protein DDP54_12775 [Cellulomonas sp. WB94]|uniref:cation transporting ATPase C-terminal domain-containing protein n=1 Tax=Cellulomonas sp. WB94 TaxID=2173174 RepID=UPI000D568434|nr:cation transporting ATPase C-terminal domain-containing protein [Cellulomonas sp. WB94]PVU83724.1 hypothetical protein DDP54_12775 [Cellulomonas sp. WB94]
MASDHVLPAGTAEPGLDVVRASALTADDVLRRLDSARGGLSDTQAAARFAELGPNAVRSDEARWLPVLVRQVRSPLLVLLVVAAIASYFVGERTSAVIIGAILVVSVGLGFVNEYRAVRAAEALHSQIRHTCVVVRGGHPVAVDVTALVPGDVVDLQLGEIVPADLRLLEAWDIHFIRRFMLFFGPISSLFDFATFAIMLGVFHAGPAQFRSGWFVESLATQTLVIFAVRTRRIPSFSSRPSAPLLASALGIVVIGALVPSMPFASALGFGALPTGFFLVLVLLAACYLALIELGKRWFYRAAPPAPARATVGARERRIGYRILRRARRFTSAGGNR